MSFEKKQPSTLRGSSYEARLHRSEPAPLRREAAMPYPALSRSGFYAARHRQPSTRRQRQTMLTNQISAIHSASRDTYGAPRIHAELAAQGVACSHNTVAKLMRQAAIMPRCIRRLSDSGSSTSKRLRLLRSVLQPPAKALVTRIRGSVGFRGVHKTPHYRVHRTWARSMRPYRSVHLDADAKNRGAGPRFQFAFREF